MKQPEEALAGVRARPISGCPSPRLRFDRLSLEQGLSQSIVSCAVLDHRGFLWFGTEDGLNRFDGYGFRTFRHSVDDPTSLSYSEVRCLIEDRRGALWVGTFDGLNRFAPESETSTRFLHRKGDQGTLGGNLVRSLIEDLKGNIWVGTQGAGLDRLEPDGQRFEHHRHLGSDPESLADDTVQALTLDREGGLWIGTAGGGLDFLAPGARTFRHFRHDPAADAGDGLSDDDIRSLLTDRHGRIWIGTKLGLDLMDPETEVIRQLAVEARGHPITALCEDAEDRIWAASDGSGLFVFDRDGDELINIRNDPRHPTSLASDRVWSCCRDGTGGLWFGTYGAGIGKLDLRRDRIAHIRCDPNDPDDPISLGHAIVWSMWEDREGELWVGTDGGLDRFDRTRSAVRHYRSAPERPGALGHPAVRVVYEGPSGTLWVGTNGGLHRFDRGNERFQRFCHDPEDPTSLSHDEIRSLCEDRTGALWIGTLGGGLNLFDSSADRFVAFRHSDEDPDSLSSDFVRPLLEDRRGDLWIGTQGGGLNRFDRESGRFVRYRHDPGDATSLSSDHVFAIWEDSDGLLWIGTYAGGLDQFDPDTGRVERYGLRDGLPADLIYGVIGDLSGGLWISTNRGLSRFDPATKSFRNFDWRDGLQSDEFNGGSFHRSREGELFFGGIDGLNSFFPGDLTESDFQVPVVLTDFQLANRTIRVGEQIGGRVLLTRNVLASEKIRLSYRDRVFTIQFAALDFTNPGKNRYAYRLVGFDSGWIPTEATRPFATYTNLPPGRYRFEVRGSNVDGIWGPEPASIEIEVEPPIWRRRWFQGLSFASGLAVAWSSYRRRLNAVRMETELRAAHDAQESIWPKAAPALEGFDIAGISLPASEVGGDFFDYAEDPDNATLCVAIGDVAGKGMQAAMSAVLTNGLLLAQLAFDKDLEEIMARLDRTLARKLPRRSFAALCLARICADSHAFEWVNAGLPEPLLKSGSRVRFLSTPQPPFPLGLGTPGTYVSQREKLDVGDVLLLCSDGLPEAQSSRHEVYGYDRLNRRLGSLETSNMSAREILTAILEDVSRFVGEALIRDDQTAIVIKTVGGCAAGE